jgi:hypothetical protein
MSDDRPPKVPKITDRPPKVPKITPPDAHALGVTLGSEFDSKCREIDALGKHDERIEEWRKFFASTPNFYDARRHLQQIMLLVDRKTAEDRLRQCESQLPLQKAIIEQYCDLICISDTSRKYLFNMFEILNINNKQCYGSVAVYTAELFDRFAATFGTLQDMERWFVTIPERKFDVKDAEPIDDDELEPKYPQEKHKISNAALQVAEVYGVRCLLFAMCGYLAAKNLDDVTMDEWLLEMFKSIVFFDHKTRSTVVDQLHYDILILELAVLDRLEWRTHVSVGSYAERVKDMPGVPEKEKEKILEMFAENDKF